MLCFLRLPRRERDLRRFRWLNDYFRSENILIPHILSPEDDVIKIKDLPGYEEIMRVVRL